MLGSSKKITFTKTISWLPTDAEAKKIQANITVWSTVISKEHAVLGKADFLGKEITYNMIVIASSIYYKRTKAGTVAAKDNWQAKSIPWDVCEFCSFRGKKHGDWKILLRTKFMCCWRNHISGKFPSSFWMSTAISYPIHWYQQNPETDI